MLTAATPPKVIAFDEPTSSLSEHEVEALFRLIGRLRDSGVAVVYVSHRMKEIFQLADRVAVLRDGKLVGVQQAAETDEAEPGPDDDRPRPVARSSAASRRTPATSC